jgi:hypothetical protein
MGPIFRGNPLATNGSKIILWICRSRQICDESRISNFPAQMWALGTSVMETFERMCLGSALTGFVVLVVATLVLFTAG